MMQYLGLIIFTVFLQLQDMGSVVYNSAAETLNIPGADNNATDTSFYSTIDADVTSHRAVGEYYTIDDDVTTCTNSDASSSNFTTTDEADVYYSTDGDYGICTAAPPRYLQLYMPSALTTKITLEHWPRSGIRLKPIMRNHTAQNHVDSKIPLQ
jgi:hypothetical protein